MPVAKRSIDRAEILLDPTGLAPVLPGRFTNITRDGVADFSRPTFRLLGYTTVGEFATAVPMVRASFVEGDQSGSTPPLQIRIHGPEA